jgi:tetratricopeptide (TPR) repeat protein/DNA-binding CsgD family transcriptional regulator
MVKSSPNNDAEHFSEAEQEWDLKRLLGDIEAMQDGKKLAPRDQDYLKAILLGYSPSETSRLLFVGENTVKVAFSKISRLIEDLTAQAHASVTHKNAPLVLQHYRKGAEIAVSPDKEVKAVSKPVISNQTLPAIPVWHGREDLLKTLQEALQEPMLRVLVLMGQGGIGKTSLAVKLLEAIQGDYEQTYFLKVQEGSSFDDLATLVLGDLRVNCKTDDESICAIANLFSKQRCLLVLDELEKILKAGERSAVAEGWGKLLNTFANNQHNSHIILTSRELPADLADQRGGEIDPMLVRVVTVEGVNQDASIAILKDRKLKDADQDLEWVAQRVDGHVFLLSQLAALAKDRKGYLRRHPELVTKKSDPILQEQLARQGDEARDLLRRMGVLRVAIHVEGLTFLRLYAEEARFEKAVAAGVPVEFTDEELEKTEAIIEQLTAASLVQKRYDEERCSFLYDLHRITIDFLQKAYADSLPDFMEIAYRFYYTGKTINNPQSMEDLLPIKEAQHFAFQLGKYREAIHLVIDDLERYMRLWGYWKELNEIYELLQPFVDKYVEGSEMPNCLCKIGISYRDIGKWDLAKDYLQKALELSTKSNSEKNIADILIHLGDIEDKYGNWKIAESLIRQSFEISNKLGILLEKAEALLLLAEYERKWSNWDLAEEMSKQARKIFEEFGDFAGSGRSLFTLASIEFSRLNLDECQSLLDEALKLFRWLNDRYWITRCKGYLGTVEFRRKNLDEAECIFTEVRNLRKELGDIKGMLASIKDLAKVELARGNLTKAEEYLIDILPQMEISGIAWSIADTKFYLAIIEKRRGNLPLAQKYYEEAREIFGKVGAKVGLARIEREWLEVDV